MARSAAESTSWVASVMKQKTGVQEVEQLTDRSIRISRAQYMPYVAGILSVRDVTSEDVAEVLATDPTVDIIINIPGQGIWQGSGIAAAQAAGVAFGGMGDLQSCIAKEEPRTYVKSEFAFIERAVRQHSRVAGVTRDADRVFRLHRQGLPDFSFVVVYAYELTAEDLRNARERYGAFDKVLNSNPNGKPTDDARRLARDLGIELHMMRTLLGRINSP